MSIFAAQLTATLQSGDNLTPFYGTSAFVDAYNAATDGDIITHSPGSFTAPEINKSISVIGAYAFSTDASVATKLTTDFTVIADNVCLEAISANSITIKGADNLTISRCNLANLKNTENGDDKYHDNTTVKDSKISSYQAMSLSKNTVLRNCCINYFYKSINEAENPALIENCNIPIFAYSDDTDYKQPFAIYRNCLLGLYNNGTSTSSPTLSLSSPSEFHSVIFYQNFRYVSTSSSAKSWTINFNSCVKDNAIQQGTQYAVGTTASNLFRFNSFDSFTYVDLTVGPVDRKDEPAIPQITASEIDTETDADGTLHVKITAKARD